MPRGIKKAACVRTERVSLVCPVDQAVAADEGECACAWNAQGQVEGHGAISLPSIRPIGLASCHKQAVSFFQGDRFIWIKTMMPMPSRHLQPSNLMQQYTFTGLDFLASRSNFLPMKPGWSPTQAQPLARLHERYFFQLTFDLCW